jgi:hypothetical protein
VTEFGYFGAEVYQLPALDKRQLVILDSVAGYTALYATVDNSNVLITSSNGVPLMIPTKAGGMYRALHPE